MTKTYVFDGSYLPTGVINSLENVLGRDWTPEQLKPFTDKELLRWPYMGKKGLLALRAWLGKHPAEQPVAEPVCEYCGGGHATICPTIKAIEYHPDGAVKRVEFKTDLVLPQPSTNQLDKPT